MNKHGDYILHLYNMKDYIVEHNGIKYVFCQVISQRLKPLDSTLYRRWFQLMQFTLNVRQIYGVSALPVVVNIQVKDGHTSSLTIVFETTPGQDYIEIVTPRH